MPWLLQPRIRLGCSINAAAHCRVDGGLKNEIVAGSFIVGCFFAIVVMNLITTLTTASFLNKPAQQQP